LSLRDVAAKLERIVPLLGSPVDGECLGAARAIVRTLQGGGSTLHDLAEFVGRAGAQHIADDDDTFPPFWQELSPIAQARWISAALSTGRDLSQWELSFVLSIDMKLRGGFQAFFASPRQANILTGIIAKLFASGVRI
jgi:hypothetical protein